MALRADDVDLGRDRDLVERYQNGDPSAFDDLYRCYFDRLHRFCRRHTSDVHEAEEIAQEAFVRALRSMDTLTGERRFYPWMTVIAKRLTIDRHRKLSRLELTDEPDLGSVDPDIDHLFDAVDAGHVRDAMDALGPRHREVLLLREAEGLSYAQIADHLEVPVTTVEALLHRARKALRREYAAVGGDARGLWGIPLFGLAATKLGALRSRVHDRWVEIGAVAAPVAVGAVTAAVVLLPDAGPAPVETTMPATTRAPVTVETAEAPAAPDAPVVVASPAPTPAPSSSATSVAPPSVEAGPVDVFVGPEGTERARDEARQMPVVGDAGPATAGADPPLTVEDLAEFLDGATDFLFTSPDPTPSLGGTP